MKKLSLLFSFSLLFFLLPLPQAYAANGTIMLSPEKGSFDKPFKITLTIDGNGEKFNAANATITMPTNIKIKDLVLGDCNLSFLTTPNAKNLSFEGVILSASSTKCTAYTATAVPAAKGNAQIAITQASIKRYGDAAEILTTKQNAKYSITGVSKEAAVLGEKTESKAKNYTLTLQIHSEDPKLLKDATIILTPVSKKNPVKEKVTNKNTANLKNVAPGIYDVTVENNDKKIGEAIINVNGSNKELTLGINLDTQKNNPLLKDTYSIIEQIKNSPLLLAGIAIGGCVLGIIITFLIMKFAGRRKTKSD